MQRLALALGAVASLVASAQARQDLQDAAQLFQNSVDVRGKPLADMAELMKKLATGQYEHHHPQPTAAPKRGAQPLTEQERQELDRQARLSAMGDAVTLIVREPTGHEFVAKFHAQAKMQVLLHSVCGKLGIDVQGAGFTHDNKVLDPTRTPTELGLVDQDVIEIDSGDLQAMKAKKEAGGRNAREVAALQERWSADQRAASKRMEVQLQNAQRSAKEQAQQKMSHDRKKMDMVTLRFLLAHGDGNEIPINVKKNNGLAGTMELVCKRLELDCAKSRFYASDKTGGKMLINPHDSVQTLDLVDDQLIMIRGIQL